VKFANINNNKTEATTSGEVAVCRLCGEKVRAYCGEKNIWHWRHANVKECDSWHESETEWHRSWKNLFNNCIQEHVMFDHKTGEKHIADVYNIEKKLVIELQHSPIKESEIESREIFYDKMIWLVDLIDFKNNIMLYDDPLIKNFVKDVTGYTENRSILLKGDDIELDNWLKLIYDKIEDGNEYLFLNWKYEHKRWKVTTRPLFFDLGDDNVYYAVNKYKFAPGYLVKRIEKNIFINHYNTLVCNEDV
jgi:competence CoiA-like predicted nuclease